MAYQLGGIICSGPDEWLIRIAAVCPGDHLQWSLRELLWRYDAVQDYDTRRSCEIIAGLYNVQRTKPSDRVWSWQDFTLATSSRRGDRVGGKFSPAIWPSSLPVRFNGSKVTEIGRAHV